MFCLLVVLVKLSLLAKWLARKTPLRKPNRSEGIVSTKPRLKNVYDSLGLLHCLIVCLSRPRRYVMCLILVHTAIAWYSLCVLSRHSLSCCSHLIAMCYLCRCLWSTAVTVLCYLCTTGVYEVSQVRVVPWWHQEGKGTAGWICQALS